MKKFATIAIAAIAMAGLASEARADLMIDVSSDGSTFTNICTVLGAPTSDISCAVSTFTSGTITGKVQGAEADQTSTLSQLLSSATSLTNTGTATADIYIRVTGTGYTSPTGSAELTSQIGGSVATGSVDNLLTYSSSAQGQATSPLSPGITDSASSYNASNMIAVTGLTAPFDVMETIHFTLGAGSKLNYSASSTLTPVPEPASMALFGLGLVGVAGKLRRRLGSRA
jgi:hypothetical protein